MPAANLAAVTQSLQTLLRSNIQRLSGLEVTVSPRAPNVMDLDTVMNTLSTNAAIPPCNVPEATPAARVSATVKISPNDQVRHENPPVTLSSDHA